jgi:hypothetical protein
MMIFKNTFRLFLNVLFLLLLITGSLHGQNTGPALERQVHEFVNDGDYASLDRLIDSEEALWKKEPSVAYYRDMFAIGGILTGGTTAQSYWLGRKVLWKMLFKSVPSEYGAAQDVYVWKDSLLSLSAEAITPYVNNLSPEMFAVARHDTFLMLQEYARQLHAAIIPGYRDKYSAPMNDWAGRQRFKQNAVDNQIQVQAGKALVTLATSIAHIQYLIDAYSHDPRDDDELKALLDILNVKGADREKVIRDTR